jgi:DNA-directed RNA polymerase subunit RPC12/RpoP
MERCDRCGAEVADEEACPGCGLAPKSEPPCAECGTRLAYRDVTSIRRGYANSVLVLFSLGASCTFSRLASANTPVLGVILLLVALGLAVKGTWRIKVLRCPRCGRRRVWPRRT